MKYIIKKYAYCVLIAGLLLSGTGCRQNFVDPNNAPDEDVFKSVRGITGVAVGLQRVYAATRAGSLYNRITLDGFVTNQYIIINRGNTAEDQLDRGGNNVDGTNTILAALWTSSNKILFDADKVLAAAATLGDKNYASGLIGYTTIFKALALGDLAMYWERIPAGIGVNVQFIARTEGFTKAIVEIDKALAAIQANAISSSFTANIPAGIDIVNTLNALKARYSLYTGSYAQALAAANAVDITKKSTFNFDAVNVNPIFETAGATNNVFQPVDSTMGLPAGIQPDLADKRVPFYMTTVAGGIPRFRMAGFSGGNLVQWPLYLPGEIQLIKAECLARQATPDLATAQSLLNGVITKQPAADPFGVGAGLPAIGGQLNQADLLTQIYRHRSIELFMSGLKLEDMRRFARPNTERRRNLMPYPFRERDSNPNTPPDPAF